MSQPAAKADKQPSGKVLSLPGASSPPHNLEAEQAVIGAILIRPAVLSEVAAVITPHDFYREDHRKIYQAMLDLYDRHDPIDLPLLNNLLKERGQFEEVGGPVFLMGLSDHVGVAANAANYAQIVRDKASLRRVIARTQEITGACLAPVEDVAEFLDWASQGLFEIAETTKESGAICLDKLVATESLHVEAAYYNKGKLQTGSILVGFKDLERFIIWEPGDLIVLAARPSMGKTALALNFMLKVAMGGQWAGIFTLETSKEKLTRRFMSIIGRINGHRMKQGKLTMDEWEKFVELQDMVDNLPLWIDDTPSLSITEMRTRARREYGRGRLSFLVVDYLQLTKPLPGNHSREQQVAEVSRGLKALAKELKIPILAVSAINRKFADRPNKRPLRSDLRESGAIEYDADTILLLYREEEDKPDTQQKGIAEVDVDKQKDGPTGLVKLTYLKEILRFEDLAPELF